MADPTIASSSRNLPGWVLPVFQWLTVVNAVLIVLQAFLAGEGVFGGERGLVTGHGHLGNAVFALVVIQGVLAFMLAQRGMLSRAGMMLAGVVILLVFAQIGLGYSTRNNIKITAYHMANGVLLMGTLAALAAIAWTRPASRTGR